MISSPCFQIFCRVLEKRKNISSFSTAKIKDKPFKMHLKFLVGIALFCWPLIAPSNAAGQSISAENEQKKRRREFGNEWSGLEQLEFGDQWT
jgi:hypothetical protein